MRVTRIVRSIGVTLVTGAVALGTAGCGGEQVGEFADAAALASAVTEQTADAKSSTFTMSMELGGVSMTAEGSATYAGADTAMELTMQASGVDIEMVFVDREFYMTLPADAGGDPEKPWFRIDPADFPSGDPTKMMDQADPSKSLEQMAESGEVIASEESDVDGTPATKYTVEMDFDAAMAEAVAAGGDTSMLEGLDIDTIEYAMWLNADNLPVRMEMDMSEVMAAVAEKTGTDLGGDGGMMVFTYSDWGAPVDIQAPPEDQIGESPFPG